MPKLNAAFCAAAKGDEVFTLKSAPVTGINMSGVDMMTGGGKVFTTGCVEYLMVSRLIPVV